MRHKTRLLILVISSAFFAVAQQPQEVLSGISARPVEVSNPPPVKKSSVFIQLPFFDDFSYRRHKPVDSLWENDQVYINQTYAKSPPTLGVATFDGLNHDGWAYDLEKFGTDSADVLTSKGIDLSTTQDSVYLSFFYQAGGYGEAPESGDSLSLYFYSPVTQEWSWAWGVDASQASGNFEVALVPVTDPSHLQAGFKFRLVSYGALAGAYDIWNVDYFLLDDQRNYNSNPFIRKDPAFTRPFPSLLNDYEAIPWFHYTPQLAQVLNKQDLTLYYQRNARTNPPATPDRYSLSLGVYQLKYNGNVLAKDLQGDPQLDNTHNYFEEIAYNYPLDDFSLPSSPTGPFSIEAFHTYGGLNEMGSNDTIYRHQVFSNYYAYDDGSAERAYYVTDNRDGVIITSFEVAMADKLRGVYIYFLPAEFDVEENDFSIVIYENNNGSPGNLIYETDSVYTPQYTGHNFYLPYVLDDTLGVQIPTSGCFVGIRQLGRNPIPIGFDMNTTGRTELYYGEPGDLYKSFQKGSIMIRPFMRNLPADLGGQEPVAQKAGWEVYPNPSHGELQVQGLDSHEKVSYQLIDLTGRVVDEGQAGQRIEFRTNLKEGLYILHLQSQKTSRSLTTKIMIR